MRTTVEIDGQPVEFEATALTPITFMKRTGKDLLRILNRTNKDEVSTELYEAELELAFIMAKSANPEIQADSMEEWINGFKEFPLENVLKKIMTLYLKATGMTIQSKKKTVGNRRGR